MTEVEILEAGATRLGVELRSSQLEMLTCFAALLRRWNGVFNLVSRRDMPRLLERHLLDSLSLAALMQGGRALDLGTGAGLPGVPLAIACPDVNFTLIDRNARCIRFVHQATIELGLSNVVAVVGDFADFSGEALFDTVVSRAVAKPDSLWRATSALLAPDGQALYQTGAQENDVGSVEAAVERRVICVPGLTRPHHVLRVTRRSSAAVESR